MVQSYDGQSDRELFCGGEQHSFKVPIRPFFWVHFPIYLYTDIIHQNVIMLVTDSPIKNHFVPRKSKT